MWNISCTNRNILVLESDVVVRIIVNFGVGLKWDFWTSDLGDIWTFWISRGQRTKVNINTPLLILDKIVG